MKRFPPNLFFGLFSLFPTFAQGTNMNVVTTNQLFQEVPSQSRDTFATGEVEKDLDKNMLGGRLWCQQVEEDSEEGEIRIDNEEDASTDDQDLEDEEQSVNGKDDDKNDKPNNEEDGKQIKPHETVEKSQEIDLSKGNEKSRGDKIGATGSPISNIDKVNPEEARVREIDKGDVGIQEARQINSVPDTTELRSSNQRSKKQQGLNIDPKSIETELKDQVNDGQIMNVIATDGEILKVTGTLGNYLHSSVMCYSKRGQQYHHLRGS
ncbi:hypothetical protein A4A49_19874 [Nicotiana attenuata]|uniref:Uncharacterized protein n=1 Tax=Nicotiana attenuata TaxID=49451 RepID=A0A1J6J8P1_NICAT|nr:hypothetical protein A4A49_19874 [Nicotiana attenuata]